MKSPLKTNVPSEPTALTSCTERKGSTSATTARMAALSLEQLTDILGGVTDPCPRGVLCTK